MLSAINETDSLQDSVLRNIIHPNDWESEVSRRLEAIESWCERWARCASKSDLLYCSHNDGAGHR
jgi:hypothetical protein